MRLTSPLCGPVLWLYRDRSTKDMCVVYDVWERGTETIPLELAPLRASRALRVASSEFRNTVEVEDWR